MRNHVATLFVFFLRVHCPLKLKSRFEIFSQKKKKKSPKPIACDFNNYCSYIHTESQHNVHFKILKIPKNDDSLSFS